MAKPTFEQMQEFFCQVGDEVATRTNFQDYLNSTRKHIARIVSLFRATVDRSKPEWTQELDASRYAFIDPRFKLEHLPLTGSVATEEEFVDLDFSGFDGSLTTQKILDEAARQGFMRLDRAASESSFEVQPTGPDSRPIVCFCHHEWTESGDEVVGCVVENAGGRGLRVIRLDDRWGRGYCVFRFGAPRK